MPLEVLKLSTAALFQFHNYGGRLISHHWSPKQQKLMPSGTGHCSGQCHARAHSPRQTNCRPHGRRWCAGPAPVHPDDHRALGGSLPFGWGCSSPAPKPSLASGQQTTELHHDGLTIWRAAVDPLVPAYASACSPSVLFTQYNDSSPMISHRVWLCEKLVLQPYGV